jgi:hypothetical protein
MIKEEKHQKNTGTFIVALAMYDPNDIRIFENKTEEYVIHENYKKIAVCSTKVEAEKAKNKYLHQHTCYLVRKSSSGYKIERYEGVITIAPIGTVAIFRKRKQAKRYITRMNENVEKAEAKVATVA